MNTPRADWYQDPQDPEGLRYWDGTQWTSQTRQPTPPPPLPQSNAFGDLTLMPPPQAVSNPTRKGVVLKSAGTVVTILGALPLAFVAVLLVLSLVTDSEDNQYSGLAALMLIGLGIPVFTIGLVMLLSGKARERRSEFAREEPNAPGAVVGVKESLVAPVLGIVFSVIPFIPLLGLMLSLYGYFGNKAGSKARLVGLIGIFVNLGVALFQVLRM